ncbi:hypothetical protein [Hyphomicrobium sp. 2TAF46]|uniref:hypothetical protein n=1 Tax=Hyphomicrobium sp. 2TAF46 TaxID=3233019 RepID=UPI003F90347C
MAKREWAAVVCDESEDALNAFEAEIGRRLSDAQRDTWFEGFSSAVQLAGQQPGKPKLYLVKS